MSDDDAQISSHATRRTPRQAKAQATVERILDCTARLLDEVGLSLTTNGIARAAGINVATLYQYFPNKEAVFLAVLHRHLQWRLDNLPKMLEGLHKNPRWRDQIRAMIETLAARRDGEPGVRSLRLAMRASPELMAENHAAAVQVAAVLADELRRASGADPARAEIGALCALEALIALLDVRDFQLVNDKQAVEQQTHALLTAFLAPYLDRAVLAAG
jgi:AcrR family transcriptional regulator